MSNKQNKIEDSWNRLIDAFTSCANAIERFVNLASMYVEAKAKAAHMEKEPIGPPCEECDNDTPAVYRTDWEADLCVQCYTDTTNGAPLPDKKTYPITPSQS